MFSNETLVLMNTIFSAGSYGSLARFRSLSRLMKVNENTVIGASGDIADFQFIQETLKQKM
jgi:20S proteasome subunit beta 7